MNDNYIYDIETYPNIFTLTLKHVNTGQLWVFEISDRKNDIHELISTMQALAVMNSRMIGFNNLNFDYPILHYILNFWSPEHLTAFEIYSFAMRIINATKEEAFGLMVWESDRLIEQIDLYKIHHFDNVSRSTSLKVLEFNMRSENIEDLPFPVGTELTHQQKDVLIQYNIHDVNETEKFFHKSQDKIKFREQLTARYDRSFMNYSDKKIGTDYFITQLEEALPGSCYDRTAGKKPRQTFRAYVDLNEVIFPYIQFEAAEFNRVKNWLASQRIRETKGLFKELSATVNGFKFDFGLGGIHGSINNAIVESNDEYIIYDWDAVSYYPNLGIKNKLYPEHLSAVFCEIYEKTYNERQLHKKGTTENAALKLALNGVYGDSNSVYSPFYDSKYTMSITINGQLLLCMLAEQLMKIPGLRMIQINTDGLTVLCPRSQIEYMNHVCKWWQAFTLLELEHAIYNRMFIRDVNNYIAEYEGGKLKRKGAYGYETPNENPNTLEVEWHKNHSALIVPKAAEAALIFGKDIREFITSHQNIYDFMLCAKAKGKSKLITEDINGNRTNVQKTSRYYVTHQGQYLFKISPPPEGCEVGQFKRANGLTDQYYKAVLAEIGPGSWDERIHTKNKSVYDERKTGVESGWLVTICNNIQDAKFEYINFEYYITETEKLVKILERIEQ